jgi:hypothetical protein
MSHRTIALSVVGLVASAAFVSSAAAQDQPDAAPTVDPEIAGAVTPLPDHLRAAATVMGYRDGRLVLLREGTNGLICLGDKAEQEGFHAACYHKDLDPFMARGRALKAEGQEGAAIDSLRQAEIENGTLSFPKEPRALYNVWSQHEFDPTLGEAPESGRLHVVYMPYATEESTGFSATPANDRPWLMDPGMPWAHLMISVK